MQAELPKFEAMNVEVVVVSFVTPERLGRYLQHKPWKFKVLADPDRVFYRAFGLESAGWLRLLRPRVLLKYLELLVRVRVPSMAEEDVHQLGGDFVLNGGGEVIFEHRSQDPADRPSVEILLEAAGKCRSSGRQVRRRIEGGPK